MDSTHYIGIAYIAGSITTYIIIRCVIKYLRARNAVLMSESDYHYMMG